MDSPGQTQEHLDEAIAKDMGGTAPAVDPLGVDAPASIPIHDSGEFPKDCRGAEASKTTAAATPQELIRHAQYLEWRAGLLAGEADALRSMAAAR